MKIIWSCIFFLVTQTTLCQQDTANIDLSFYNDYPEIPPVYPGGFMALQKVYQKNIRYLASLYREKESVKITARFKINIAGKVTDIQVEKRSNPDLDREVKRLIGLLGKWTPATQNEKKIDYYLVQPFIFRPPLVDRVQGRRFKPIHQPMRVRSSPTGVITSQ